MVNILGLDANQFADMIQGAVQRAIAADREEQAEIKRKQALAIWEAKLEHNRRQLEMHLAQWAHTWPWVDPTVEACNEWRAP
jgi:hypothetical protein